MSTKLEATSKSTETMRQPGRWCDDARWQVLRREHVSEEDGHTLMETVTALALLIGVLIPVSGIAFQLFVHDRAAKKAEALRIAERAVEQALIVEHPKSRAWRPEGLRWRVVQTVRRREGLYAIEVRVYPARNKARPFKSGEVEDERRGTTRSTAPTVTLRAARGSGPP
jgi:hypothetical protein